MIGNWNDLGLAAIGRYWRNYRTILTMGMIVNFMAIGNAWKLEPSGGKKKEQRFQ